MDKEQLIKKWKSSMSQITDDDITLIVSKIKNSKALNGGFDRLEDSIEEIKTDIKNIKENLYDPDQGLYSRIVKVDQKAEQSTKHWDNLAKIGFLVAGALITVLVKFLLH